GVMGAALASAQAWCGVIADGVHVHPATLRLLLASRAAAPGAVVLVSDSMPPAGTVLDRFVLGGRLVLRRGGRLETEDGVLAGADLDLGQAVRNAVSLLGVDGAEALRMASAYSARAAGLVDRGRMAPGLRADLVLVDAALYAVGTWVAGQWRAAADGAGTGPYFPRG
ncbi:MAG: amidohydrolase family protein, partial [Janthinobacterium lividum]